MIQEISKILAALGGITVLFYAVGFTAVQSFIHRNGLDGIFWLSSEFYRDAGARFVLELVRAPLTAWYIFFPLLISLYAAFVPKEQKPLLDFKEKKDVPYKQAGQLTGLLLIMGAVYVFALGYDRLLGHPLFARFISAAFQVTGDRAIQEQQSLAFFSFAMPVVVIGAIVLHRFRGAFKSEGKDRHAYGLMMIAYAVFLAIIPIAYGMHLYDWRTVPIRDPAQLAVHANPSKISPSAEMWLLGEFSGRYLFLYKDDEAGQGSIEVIDTKEIKRMNLDLRRSGSLKYQMAQDTNHTIQENTEIRREAIGLNGRKL